MFKLRQKSSRRNAKRKTLQIDRAEKYTSARHDGLGNQSGRDCGHKAVILPQSTENVASKNNNSYNECFLARVISSA